MKRIFRLPGSRQRAATDVEREIELHIDLRTREFEALGMSHDDARRAALAAFGDRAAFEREAKELHQSTVNQRARRDWLGELRQDITVGWRVLRRAPGFTAVALLTLGIGIGANTAVFGVLRSVLLRPLPYPHAEQLVQVWTDHRALGRAEPEWLSPPEFIDYRDGNHSFSGMAAYLGWGPDLAGVGDPESLSGVMVSGNYFDVLGTRPAIGRLFTMSDDDAGAGRVVVLSHAFWQRRFGGDASVIGRIVMLNGEDWTVVGVLPRTFRAPLQSSQPEIIRPIRRPANSRCGRGCITVRAIGRLKPGVSFASAQADLGRIAARLAREFPESNAKVGSWLVPLHEQLTGRTTRPLIALSAAVGFVLLIGCVNLANLLLVRGATRGREIAVRAALGAGRSRVVRQLVTENALLAVAGGLLGFVLGAAGSRAFGILVPDGVRQLQDIRVDFGVFLFALVITVASAAIFGLLPTLHTAKAGLMTSLREARGDGGRHGVALRGALVVTQLALAVVLLVSAGLLLRSFLLMQRVDLGFRTDGVYMTGVTFPAARYRDGRLALASIENLLARLRAERTVRSAEATDLAPLTGGDQDIGGFPVGEPANPNLPPSIWYRSVTPGYLSAIGMRLVSGRGFTDQDREGAPRVGIVNEEAARRYWPGKNPVGRVLATGPEPDATRFTIVGVVASARHDGPDQPYKPEIFVPLEQSPSRGVFLVLSPSRDLASLAGTLRQTLRDIDPLIPVSPLTPIVQRVEEAIALPRLYATLVGLFAAAALLLAALGVYGVMAYAVTQRQRELGVRLALGATPAALRAMILREGGWLALVGLTIGLGAAFGAGQLLGKLLFGVGPFDLRTFAAVPVVLGLVTLAAAWLPARRAMRLDPLTAIREV